MFDYKAIQLDVSRGRIPRLATVADRLDVLKPYGLNMLCLYIESVVESEVLTPVGCGDTPISREYLAELRRICEDREILLTPIVQILGHQEKLLALPDYQHLGEMPPPKNGSGSNNFLADSKEVKEALFSWLDEILPFVNSPFVHVGCDEVWTLGKGRSAALVAEKGIERVFANYLTTFNDFLKSRGKTLVFWADLIVDYPGILELLPSDVVISNWGYGTPQETFERDNRHFATHPFLASRGHRLWVCGNNMAEYIFNPYQRLEKNTESWLELAEQHGADCFLITDWGSYANINPYVVSLLGDLFILMKIRDPDLRQERFLTELCHCILGVDNPTFREALSLMLNAQNNPDYFPQRDIDWAPCLPGLMLKDPAGHSSTARRFGCYERTGLDRFLADMRRAHELMLGVDPTLAARPDDAQDLVMLSNRLLVVALRAQLWYDHAWDSSYRGDDEPYLAACRARAAVRQEYLQRATSDLQWYTRRWRQDNLEAEWAACEKTLLLAMESIRKIVSETGVLI